jgi:hypothetical protein
MYCSKLDTRKITKFYVEQMIITEEVFFSYDTFSLYSSSQTGLYMEYGY